MATHPQKSPLDKWWKEEKGDLFNMSSLGRATKRANLSSVHEIYVWMRERYVQVGSPNQGMSSPAKWSDS